MKARGLGKVCTRVTTILFVSTYWTSWITQLTNHDMLWKYNCTPGCFLGLDLMHVTEYYIRPSVCWLWFCDLTPLVSILALVSAMTIHTQVNETKHSQQAFSGMRLVHGTASSTGACRNSYFEASALWCRLAITILPHTIPLAYIYQLAFIIPLAYTTAFSDASTLRTARVQSSGTNHNHVIAPLDSVRPPWSTACGCA